MSITITKVKAPVAKPPVETSDTAQGLTDPAGMSLEQLADLYGDLEDKTTAAMANPIFTRFAEVQKELAARLANQYEPTDSLEVKGAHWILEIGAAARNPSQLKDTYKLAGFLGQDTFYKIAKVTLTDVKKYCTPEQMAEVVEDNTGYGSRRKIVAKYLG